MSRKTKVLVVFGTRPEAIKMAPVINELKRRQSEFDPIICTTAQHRHLQDQVLKIFSIKPDIDLNLMRPDQMLDEVASKVLLGIKKIIANVRPDYVLIQGDTTTAFAAGLAAFYLRRKVGHLEAGLRTYRKDAPFPEEVNRKMISCVVDLHFAPTEHARDNLIKEGYNPATILVTGNTVIDALFWVLNMTKGKNPSAIVMDKISKDAPIILVTGHRRENFGARFKDICVGLKTIAERYTHYQIVYPVHLNPNVQIHVYSILGNLRNIHLIEPLEYISFVHLMKRAKFIITDSGGIQEEATTLGKPVLVMRDVTERPEAVEAGVCKLVGTNSERIVSEATLLIEDEKEYFKASNSNNLFGDGFAARRIVDALIEKVI